MSGVPMLNVDMVTTAASVAVAPAPAIVASSSTNLTVGTCTTTPLTPEILNSVMAMTNPLEYSYPANAAANANASTSKLSQVKNM